MLSLLRRRLENRWFLELEEGSSGAHPTWAARNLIHLTARDVTEAIETPETSSSKQPLSLRKMSAPGIPNLLSLRGGPRLRGGRGRGRGRATGTSDAQQRNDVDIQSTDTDAAVSRQSAVLMGYLEDPFASIFVTGPPTRRLPIINRGKCYIAFCPIFVSII
jgi:hypothetical protein